MKKKGTDGMCFEQCFENATGTRNEGHSASVEE
jgi:hypothetical protein